MTMGRVDDVKFDGRDGGDAGSSDPSPAETGAASVETADDAPEAEPAAAATVFSDRVGLARSCVAALATDGIVRA